MLPSRLNAIDVVDVVVVVAVFRFPNTAGGVAVMVGIAVSIFLLDVQVSGKDRTLATIAKPVKSGKPYR